MEQANQQDRRLDGAESGPRDGIPDGRRAVVVPTAIDGFKKLAIPAPKVLHGMECTDQRRCLPSCVTIIGS